MSRLAVRSFVVWVTLLLGGETVIGQDADTRGAARARFERALQLFDEGRHAEALIEFEAAYALFPDHRVLFNVGNVHEALGRPVEAVDAWERYLREGGEGIHVERRLLVEAALARQRARIGSVTVVTNVEGARLEVDGVEVATLPSSTPLRLAIGTYSIGVRAAGHEPSTRRVTVAGESNQRIEVLLERRATEVGSLRVTGSTPDVLVRVDGREVGRTPLRETVAVPPGMRLVEASRPGYLTFRETVSVEVGQQSDVVVRMELDPEALPEHLGRLRLRLPEPGRVTLDGRELPSFDDVVVPTGPHELVVEIPGREPARRQIVVEAGASSEPRLDWRWTVEERAARVRSAQRARRGGASGAAVGGGVLLASVATLLWNGAREDELAELRPSYEACLPSSGLACEGTTVREARRYESLDRSIEVVRGTMLGALTVGAVLITIGAVIAARSPGEAEIDAAAGRVELSLGVGRLEVTGSF
ncbi:MAG: PEGA domain-containing protein [Myxococcota bacterium]|jgi:hypothetical protein|nr:PEGA domain-containing protein [Myxococcota bacterium]